MSTFVQGRHLFWAAACLLAAILLTLFSTDRVRALVSYYSLHRLTREADLVITGEVTTLDSYMAPYHGRGEAIFTDVTIRVDRVLQGEPDGSEVTVRQLGGRIDSRFSFCPDSPHYEIGEQVMVFLQESGGVLRTVGWFQGKYRLYRDATMVFGREHHAIANDISVADVDKQLQILSTTPYIYEKEPISNGRAIPQNAMRGGGGEFETIGLAWPDGEAPFYVNNTFPPDMICDISEDEAEDVLLCAAEAWRDQSRADFRFDYMGITDVDQLNILDEHNVIFWTNDDGEGALAATLFFGDDGVYEAFDIAMYTRANSGPIRWNGAGEPEPGSYDIQGIITHELGHALGLDHSTDPEATMFAIARNWGLPQRSLHRDDWEGVESIYGLRTDREPRIEITRVDPPSGTQVGGNEVILEGTNFTYDSDTDLWVGDRAVPAGTWRIESCDRLRILDMPWHEAGPVSIAMANTISPARIVLEDAYLYQPSLAPLFQRGDANGDGGLDISDAISILGYLFLGRPSSLPCMKSADADDDGGVELTDAVYLLNYKFLSSPAPGDPFPDCGPDPTPDGLGCGQFPPCESAGDR